MPELRSLDLSGASEASFSGFSSENNFDCDLSGASIASGTMDMKDIDCIFSGASAFTLTGQGTNIKIDASGASIVNLEDTVLEAAEVDLSGASYATVNVSERLTGDLSGASKVYYYGEPNQVDVSTSGSSEVIKK